MQQYVQKSSTTTCPLSSDNDNSPVTLSDAERSGGIFIPVTESLVIPGGVSQAVGVVHTGATGERKEIGRKTGQREVQEGNGSRRARGFAQLHFVVCSEFQVMNVLRPLRQQGQKLVEVFGRGVVRAGRANDKQGLQSVVLAPGGFERTQRVHLTG